MSLGDGVRRNFAKITQGERTRFVAAVKKMHDVLLFSDNISYFKKQEQTHELAHGSAVSPHDPAVFLVWHGELLRRFEILLRMADPDLSLHYWDWTEDARQASDGVGGTINLMTATQMGDDGSSAINRILGSGVGQGGGDVGNPFANFESEPIGPNPTDPDPQAGLSPKDRTFDFPGHNFIWRKLQAGAPHQVADATITAASDYPALIGLISPPHNATHHWFGGTLQIEHLAASDPFFFLYHSNVHRLFTLWQLQPGHPERLDGNTIFGPWETDPSHQLALASTMLPWDGSNGVIPWIAGNTEPTGGVTPMTPRDPRVIAPSCYDTNPSGDLHLVAINAAGHLWHSIRFADESWQPFGDVEGQTGEMGDLSDVSVARVGSELHLAAISAAGRLWHTIRFADQTWQPFGDIEGPAGEIGDLSRVAVASIGPDLHSVAINGAGRLWHAIRFTDGSWQPFGDVEGQTGEMGDLRQIAVAAVDSTLQVAAINGAGRLWHTVRFADGSWQPFGDVEGQTGEMGDLSQVAVAEVGSTLHVAAINAAGHLWHTIRFADGSWQPFGDVEGPVGEMGDLIQVGVTAFGSNLHIAGINAAGRLWHTIRFVNGSWQPFGDVEGNTGEMGDLRVVSIGAMC